MLSENTCWLEINFGNLTFGFQVLSFCRGFYSAHQFWALTFVFGFGVGWPFLDFGLTQSKICCKKTGSSWIGVGVRVC